MVFRVKQFHATFNSGETHGINITYVLSYPLLIYTSETFSYTKANDLSSP